MTRFRKALAALIGGIPSWGVVAQVDGIDQVELWGLAGVIATALLVWVVPNDAPDDETLIQRLREGFPIPDDIPATGSPED